MSNDSLTSILIAAQARRDAGQWEHAARLFRRAEMLAPAAANIKHNLAMVYFAKGETNDAQSWAERAIAIDPSLWQSHALLARLSRAAGDAEGAEAAWREVLQHSRGNPTALLGLADLAMNEFGDPAEAIALVSPLRENAGFAVDAELTTLMASLYLGGDARIISDRLTAFSRSNMRLPLRAPGVLRSGRRRIGLISPLFSASPVYYLTYSAWVAVAQHHDLIFFNRGLRRDWATDCFRSLASDWVDVANVDAAPLAQRIADAEIDVLFDLGGWADVIGLTALSTKPASRMYKWVGGQSATTGLEMFDGWIGDDWQSPLDSQPLYAEPIINIAGGYVDYTPPSVLATLTNLPRSGVGLVGNPAKIGQGILAAWPSGVDKVILIDRRYSRDRVLDRVKVLLGGIGVAVERVIVPRGQEEYLRALAGREAIVNTQPYAAGLTAVEAHALGIPLLTAGTAGPLFCSRHHLSHRRTGGRNRALAPQLLQLIAQ